LKRSPPLLVVYCFTGSAFLEVARNGTPDTLTVRESATFSAIVRSKTQSLPRHPPRKCRPTFHGQTLRTPASSASPEKSTCGSSSPTMDRRKSTTDTAKDG
jgi:hypothetical protein